MTPLSYSAAALSAAAAAAASAGGDPYQIANPNGKFKHKMIESMKFVEKVIF